MDALTFDGLARQMGRRRTLQALGAAAVTAVSGASLTSAKNGKNNNKKHRKKKQEKLQRRIDQESLALCASQVPACITLLTANCNGNAECQALGQTCCRPLETCDFAGLVTCIEEANNN